MDVISALKQRRACHHFLPNQKVSEQVKQQLFEATLLTPSGYNIQPWEFVVIEDAARKSQLKEIAFKQQHVEDAAFNVVVIGDLDFAARAEETVKLWEQVAGMSKEKAQAMLASLQKERSEDQLREMTIRNVGLVSMSLMLAAEDLGLATCPMMGFSKWKMRDFLQLPDNKLPGMLIAVGYRDPDADHGERLPRRKVVDIVHNEIYNQK